MKKSKVYAMAVAGMMAALAIILDFVSVRTDSTKYTLYALPLLICGFLFGPWVGLLSGCVSGFIMQMILYGPGPTTIIWMLAPMMWGFISGLLHRAFHFKNTLIATATTIAITSLSVTLVNTLAIWLDGLIFHYPTPYVLTTLGMRLGVAIILIFPYTLIVYLLMPRLEKALNLS